MKISIITTTFNSSKTILKCISSIKKQSYRDIEMIWIDNSSTDETYKILDKYKNKKTKLIKVKRKSISEAWNIGVKKSNGDIIGFLNSDDTFSNKNTIKKIVNTFKFKNCNSVYTDIFYVDDKGKIIRNWKANIYSDKNQTYEYFTDKLKFGWMMPHPGLYLKKNLINKVGFFDNNYKVSFDYDFIVRLLKNKKIKAFYLPIVSVKMLIGGNSNKIKNIVLKMREDLRIIKKHKIGGYITLFFKNLSKLNQFFK
jgi:glycosyltransferase